MISAFWFDSFEISLLDAYVKKQPVYDAEQIFALTCIYEFDCNIKELSTKIHFKVNDAFIKQYSDVRCFIKTQSIYTVWCANAQIAYFTKL